jgi:lysophospholipase L1-like esterase
VKTGGGEGKGGLWGWGAFLGEHFDLDRVSVENHALGGRSSRTFQTEGLWADVLRRVEPGDYVIMQFGHNDGIEPDNPRRPRGSLRGTGAETVDIIHPHTGEPETVYTYGQYMRNYVEDTREHGARPIVASLIPRNMWTQEGTVVRDNLGYALWARQVAEEEDAPFIPLNEMVARRYEAEGPGAVRAKYFLEDHTHTTEAGARLNAAVVAEGLRAIEDLPLKAFLKDRENE